MATVRWANVSNLELMTDVVGRRGDRHDWRSGGRYVPRFLPGNRLLDLHVQLTGGIGGVGNAVGGLGRTAQAAGGALRPKKVEADGGAGGGVGDGIKTDLEDSAPYSVDGGRGAGREVEDSSGELHGRGKD